MLTQLIRDLIAANEGNEPETFQFLTEAEPSIGWFGQLFAIDLRALSTLRILLGIISIVFVFNQFAYIELLYTDRGIMNRAHNQQILGGGFWSLLWISGTTDFARAILIFAGLVAGVFALGYQTRLMNATLLVLIWSIQVRNPLVLTGGDVLLRMLLFWCLFLPTAATWSVDAAQMETRPSSWKIASIGTLGIMAQVVFMYFFTGLAKLNPFWINGDAVQYAMSLEMSVKPLGQWLSGYPKVMWVATLATLVAEILTLLVMFIPRVNHFNRGMMMGFFLFLHIGIWLTMSIGLFSLTALAAWVIFMPSDLWNTFWGTPVGFDSKRFYRGEVDWFDKLLKIFATVFLIYITVQNVVFAMGPSVSNRLSALELFGRSTMTIQQFHMFAKPPLYSPWFEYNAQLDSGRKVDIFYPQRPDIEEKPESVYRYMQNQNWRRIHWNLITHPQHPPETELVFREVRRRLLKDCVKRWDSAYLDEPVLKAELVCHLEPIVIDDVAESTFDEHKPYKLTWALYQSDSGQ